MERRQYLPTTDFGTLRPLLPVLGVERHGNMMSIDRVIKRTLPDGNSFSYTYEGGALKTITDMEERIYTLKFNSRQELQQLVFPNGIHRTWEYDERGRLVKQRTSKVMLHPTTMMMLTI